MRTVSRSRRSEQAGAGSVAEPPGSGPALPPSVVRPHSLAMEPAAVASTEIYCYLQ